MEAQGGGSPFSASVPTMPCMQPQRPGSQADHPKRAWGPYPWHTQPGRTGLMASTAKPSGPPRPGGLAWWPPQAQLMAREGLGPWPLLRNPKGSRLESLDPVPNAQT